MRKIGFTLVELLVVISIIGVLMALTISGVSSATAQARRMQCSERMRQVSMAMINHQLSRDRLPGYLEQFGEFVGGVDPADSNSYAGNVPRHFKVGTWQVALLGDLDNLPIYEQWTMDRYPVVSDGAGERAATDDGYSSVAGANLEIFQCPSASGTMQRWGRNQFVANTGMHADTFPFTYLRPGASLQTVSFARSMSKVNGALSNQYAGFNPNAPTQPIPTGKATRINDFKDGATNTMLITESHQAKPWYMTALTGNTNHLTNIQPVSGKDRVVYPIESRYLQGCVWHFEDDNHFASAAPVSPLHKINGGDVYNLQMNISNRADLARPSSLHIGGVNMSMADGSTRFTTETIDYRTFQALMTPHGRNSDVPMNEHIPTSEI